MERLRELRLKRGMTQTQVGDLIGVSCVTIGRYEAGEREPSNAKIAALADYFGVSVDYLMGHDQQQETAFSSPKQQQILSELGNLSEEQLEEVLRYAEYVKQKK